MPEMMREVWGATVNTLSAVAPKIFIAVLILLGAWFAAVVLRALLRKSLRLLKINDRLKSTDSPMDVEGGVAMAAFYIVLIFGLVAFFDALQLDMASAPLQGLLSQVANFVPRLVAAGVLLLVAWAFATFVRVAATRGLAQTRLDERLSSEAGMKPMSASLGNVLYGLILLLFLPAVLGALQLQGLLEPVQGMVQQILAMLPNILGAAVVGIVGWFVARILRDLVGNLLSATGVDSVGERAGLRGTMSLSRLIGLVVYVLVLVPAITAALQALQIRAISEPATEMLNSIMGAIPDVFAATLILSVSYLVGRLICELLANLLGGVGFDRVPEKIGFGRLFSAGDAPVPDALPGGVTPSHFVARLSLFVIMLFASVEAANRLGFAEVSQLLSTSIRFGGQVLVGTALIAVGIWLSNIAHSAITRLHGGSSMALANVARFGILGIVIAMGLRAMGLADDIVNLAFGLTLGAVAVAVALSFGLGGREAAGKQMEYWLSRLRRGESR